jgi:hypothetical protein
MASRGLLGALGGLGAGVSQVAGTLFSVEIEKDREARLQAIEDKRYARSREDSLADYQRARTDQLADIASQREFQTGLLEKEQNFQRETANTKFGQQVALQTLGEAQQKRLIEFGQEFPDTQLGKLIQERDKYEPGSAEYNQYQQQINQSQLIQNTNPYTGATSIGIPVYDENNNLTDVQEVVTFGGLGDMTGSSAGRTPPPAPEAPEIDQAELQEQIDAIEAMPEDENGMIDLGRGPINKAQLLQKLRGGLAASAPPGSTSRFAIDRLG